MEKCDTVEQQVRGKCVSGRVWKNVRTKPNSHNKQPKGIKMTYAQRCQEKARLLKLREIDRTRKENKAQRKEANRLKEQKKKELKEQNAKKSEVFVPISNPAKIRKMRKSQLRMIEKR